MLYRTEINTINRRAASRAWPLTNLNVPVKIIGGGGGQAPRPLPIYSTEFSTLVRPRFFFLQIFFAVRSLFREENFLKKAFGTRVIL